MAAVTRRMVHVTYRDAMPNQPSSGGVTVL